MLELINDLVSQPPIFRDPRGGAPGLSFNNVLASVIVTPSGFNAFINNDLNDAFKIVLSEWCDYLNDKNSDSARDLTHEKWLSKESIIILSKYLDDFNPDKPFDAFKNAFVAKENYDDPHWGFKTWNDFFARPFISINDYRPMPPSPLPSDQDPTILSPADSKIYGIATNVSEKDTFWLKGHRYSLRHLLNSDKGGDRHKDYIGGTVYQAYLLPSDYHRWTMPFAGTVKEIVTIPGTYFALSNSLVDREQPDEFASLVEALPYLVTVSGRKLAKIEAKNPKIGTVYFIPVGLQEISAMKFEDNIVGKPLERGDPLGTFQYGGSTVCMVFEPKVNIKWAVSQLEHVLIRSKIASVY